MLYHGTMNTSKRIIEPEYITDHEGHRTKVVLPIEAYEELLEDLHDLSVAFERRDEPRIPFEEFEDSLKKDGLL